MHIIAILLFPIRLVTAPIAGVALDFMIYSINQMGGPQQYGFWYNLLPVTGAWIMWG
jgi:hypothetical protein